LDELLSRFLPEMIGRIDGPLSLRLFLQPTMALAFAFRDGRRDAREGHSPYGWALLSDPEHRQFLLRDGWKGFAKVFVIAVLLDLVYQTLAIGGFRPVQALVTACLLAMVPYVLMRGPFNRLSNLHPAGPASHGKDRGPGGRRP
jgi:hypothetical protein